MSTVAANAVTVTGTYSITSQYSSSQGGPTITDQLSNPFTENLTIGTETAATSFFTAAPADWCSGPGCSGHIETDTLTASFTFTAPGPTSPSPVSETATFTANYDGTLSCSSSYGQADCIDWTASPLIVNFTDGAVLDVYLNNASDWDITPTIQFELVDGSDAPVPEPASMALFGSALMGFSLIRRRRKGA